MKMRWVVGVAGLAGCTEFPAMLRDAGGQDVSMVVDSADVTDVSVALDGTDVPGMTDVPMAMDVASDTVVPDVPVALDVADVPGPPDAPELVDAPMDAGAEDVPADVTAADRAMSTDGMLPLTDDGTVVCPSGQVRCGSACRNLQTDALNCGACGVACALPNASGSTCAAGACRVGACAAGFADCDGSASNGCEVITQTSTLHCGACGRACAIGQTCTAGSCVAATPTCPSGMRPVPAGMFQMGDENADDPTAQPVHGVRLSAYCVDETEVTVAAYVACRAAGSCTLPDTTEGCTWGVAGLEQHPVNCVDWNQSRAYCQWRGADLPTEAQWEFAARGTDGRTYPWGNTVPGTRICWSNTVSGGDQTCLVHMFPTGDSFFGLADMAGNVNEWTLDRQGPYSGDTSLFALDPVGPGPGGSENRVHRGGAWGSASAVNFRSAYRDFNAPSTRTHAIGFRCARGPR